MTELFLRLLNVSVAASFLIAAVALLRLALRRSAPKWVFCLLWGVVALRLVLPFGLQSPFGLVPEKAVNVSAAFAGAETDPAPAAEQTPLPPENANTPEHTAQTPEYVPPTPQTPEYVPQTPPDPQTPALPDPVPGQTVPAETAQPAEAAHGAEYYLSIVWAAGFAAMLIYAAVNYVLLRRRLADSVKYQKGVRLSEKIRCPFVLGLFRPTVYLPFGLDGRTESFVLSHERAHISRGDHWFKLLWYCVLALHWYNPLVWVSFILVCRDIEYACDERVFAGMPRQDRKEYASALLELGVHTRRIAACPVAFGETNVKHRVRRVFGFKKPAVWILVLILLASAVLTACFATVRGEKSGGTDNSVESGTETSKDPRTETSNTTEAVRVKLLRPVRSTGYPGIESVYSYNEYGELSAVKRSDKSESHYAYDNGQLVTGSTNTAGLAFEYSHSPDGSYTRSYTLAGVAYVCYYNKYGDLLKKTADGETVTECFYDENGYLTESRSYYNGELTEYEKETYNEYGRLVEREISPDVGRVQIRRYEYNSAMMPVRMTVDGNTFVEWEYGYIDCVYDPSRCYDLDLVLFEPNLITGEKLKHLMFSGAALVFEVDPDLSTNPGKAGGFVYNGGGTPAEGVFPLPCENLSRVQRSRIEEYVETMRASGYKCDMTGNTAYIRNDSHALFLDMSDWAYDLNEGEVFVRWNYYEKTHTAGGLSPQAALDLKPVISSLHPVSTASGTGEFEPFEITPAGMYEATGMQLFAVPYSYDVYLNGNDKKEPAIDFNLFIASADGGYKINVVRFPFAYCDVDGDGRGELIVLSIGPTSGVNSYVLHGFDGDVEEYSGLFIAYDRNVRLEYDDGTLYCVTESGDIEERLAITTTEDGRFVRGGEGLMPWQPRPLEELLEELSE